MGSAAKLTVQSKYWRLGCRTRSPAQIRHDQREKRERLQHEKVLWHLIEFDNLSI